MLGKMKHTLLLLKNSIYPSKKFDRSPKILGWVLFDCRVAAIPELLGGSQEDASWDF